jgi:PAS domain S-box-containing protein
MDVSLNKTKFPYHLILIFILLAFGILTAGYFYYRNQKKDIKKEAYEELSAIGELKVNQISTWRKERLADAKLILENPFIAEHVEEFLSNTHTVRPRQEILEWMRTLQEHFQYQHVFLIDAEGEMILSVPKDEEVLGRYAKMLALEAMKQGKIILSDIHRGESIKDIHFDLPVPLFLKKGRQLKTVGSILLRINPDIFLYPLIQSWPTPSPTAETLLVRRKGNEVVFLNELRHKKNTALSLTIPIEKAQLLAVMAVKGKKGIIEGIDYRGVPVLAILHAIPNSPWFLISKIDREEVYELLDKRTFFIGTIASLLIIAAGFSIGFIWRHKLATFYRKQYEMEHERQIYTQRYEHLTRHANDIILLIDRDKKIVDANERAVKTYGYPRDELLSMKLEDLRAPETKTLLNGQLKEVETHNGFVFETLHHKNDGTVFPVEVSSRIMNIDGKQYYQSIIRDITERKNNAEKLRYLSSRQEAILAAVPDIIMEVDVNKVYTWANRAGFEFFGDDVLGQDAAFYFEGEQKTYESVQPLFNGGEDVIYVESWQRRVDGEKRLLAWWCRVLKDANGKVSGALSTARDITERKRVEDEIRKLNEELEKRVMERTAMLEAANKELEAFSYSVSHDLRAPLRHLTGFAELLQGHASAQLDEKSIKYLNTISSSAKHMSNLIDDLLSFSRISRSEMRKDTVDIALLVTEVLNEFQPDTKERNIAWKIDQLPAVTGDKSLLKLVFVNLISNAIKFTSKKEKAEIEIGWAKGGKGGFIDIDKEYVFYIKDNGAGFDMQYVDKLFGVFQRLHTREEFEGTGIGLANVQHVIQRHGGKVWAEGKVGEGATFYFSLPKVDYTD